MLENLLGVILILSLISFAFNMGLVFELKGTEKIISGFVCLIVVSLLLLTVISFYAYDKEINKYYKLGQQDALNGHIYYDIKIDTSKILIERKK